MIALLGDYNSPVQIGFVLDGGLQLGVEDELAMNGATPFVFVLRSHGMMPSSCGSSLSLYRLRLMSR